mmetsp:Transcript_16298/g.42237  ORF Transcript_16298/g.42237 Transcript_16298/m.42237 type:complete len:264 (+) Transcript_16298:62-853(+)
MTDDGPGLPASAAEHNLHVIKECFVYKIPPLKNESGHRANDWDVNKWLWSGRLRIRAADTKLTIYLEDSESGALFAMCPVNEPGVGPTSVEPVTDSSRYFVLRLEDGNGRHQYIGLGFRERPDAYDFNATIVDHWRGVRREREAEEVHKQIEEHPELQPALDLSLKEGETLTINLGQKKRERSAPRRASGDLQAPQGAHGILPPPPPPPPSSVGSPANVLPAGPPAVHKLDSTEFGDFTTSTSGDDGNGDDEFGDFAAADPQA